MKKKENLLFKEFKEYFVPSNLFTEESIQRANKITIREIEKELNIKRNEG